MVNLGGYLFYPFLLIGITSKHVLFLDINNKTGVPIYDLAVHPEVLEAIEGLPATTRQRVVTAFSTICMDGLNALNHKKLRWRSERDFALAISRTAFDMQLENGVTAEGFVGGNDFPTVYITALQPVEGKRRISRYSHGIGRGLPSDETGRADYITIGNNWFAAELRNPFVKKALTDDRFRLAYLPVTYPMVLASRFYGDLRQVQLAKRAEDLYGFAPRYSDAAAAAFCAAADHPFERVRFDRRAAAGAQHSSLSVFLRRAVMRPESLIIVNFIDEQDPFSRTQKEFINAALCFLQLHYRRLRPLIVDVIIKDEEGATPHWEDFLSYHGQHRFPVARFKRGLSPFSMVWGRLHQDLAGEQRELPFDGQHRLFDIDLFQGCRDSEQSEILKDSHYRVNLDQAFFNLIRAGGVVVEKGVKVEVRDLCDLSDEALREALGEIMKSSAVVLVNGEGNSALSKVAIDAACEAQLSGFPFVAIILTECIEPGSIVVPFDERLGATKIFRDLDLDPDSIEQVFEAILVAYGRNRYLSSRYLASF